MSDVDVESLKLAFATASYWSEWCVIAVAGGVFVELVALLVFSKEMPRSEKRTMVFATLLIVLGCGGEYVFGNRASTSAAQLQDASDRQIAAFRAEAKAAEGRIAEAQRDAANANERAGQANERAARLEAAAAPRDVRLPKTFVPTLAAIQKRRVVRVSSYASDAEGGRLATEVIERLRDIHFVVQDDSLTRQALRPMAFGVQVTGSDAVLVGILMSWLDESDLLRPAPPAIPGDSMVVGYGRTFNQEPPDAIIFVGSKPLPKAL